MDLASHCHSSNVEHAAEEAISHLRSAFHQKRSPSQHSDGGGEYSSTHFGESCSDEEEELHMESEETWNVISI